MLLNLNQQRKLIKIAVKETSPVLNILLTVQLQNKNFEGKYVYFRFRFWSLACGVKRCYKSGKTESSKTTTTSKSLLCFIFIFFSCLWWQVTSGDDSIYTWWHFLRYYFFYQNGRVVKLMVVETNREVKSIYSKGRKDFRKY